MTFRSILVACDFSEAASRALSFAAEIAENCRAELHLVHVHIDLDDGRAAPVAGSLWATEEQRDRYLRFLAEELHRTCAMVAPTLAERAHYHVVRGDPVKRLNETAAEVAADLVCLGATGKSRVERVLLGSVALSMIRASVIPVATVP